MPDVNSQGFTTAQQMGAYAEQLARQQAAQTRQQGIDAASKLAPQGTYYDPKSGTFKDPLTQNTYIGSAGVDNKLTPTPGPMGGLRFQEKPDAPVVVSSAQPAIQDLANKKGFLDQTVQGMTAQSDAKNQIQLPTQQQPPQGELAFGNSAFGNSQQSNNNQIQGQGDQGTQVEPQDEVGSLNAQYDKVFAKYQSDMDSLKNGTFPLTPAQQAQIDTTKAAFQRMQDSQRIANQNYVAGIKQAGITSGRQRYAPEIAMGEVQGAISAGISKIVDIESKAQEAVVNLQQAFEDRNYKYINDEFNNLSKYLKDKTDTITSMQKAVQEHEDKMADLQYKMEQDSIQNTLKMAEFDANQQKTAFDQAMTSSKFDWDMKQDAIKNMMDSDKFSWEQKQANIKNALEQGKFSYQQQKDLRDYQLDLKKLESADTPASYKEWKLAGQPGSYASYLKSKVDQKPPTADQSTAGMLVLNAKPANDTIKLMTDTYASKLTPAEFLIEKHKPDALKSQDFQRFDQAATAFVEAWLRKTSGAAISDAEWDTAFKQFLPQAGNGPEVLAQKERARANVMEGLTNAAGPAVSDEFKKNVNKQTFYSLDDYVRVNPTALQAIGKISADHPNWSEDDILQVLQSPEEDTQNFNQVGGDTYTADMGGWESRWGNMGMEYQPSEEYQGYGSTEPDIDRLMKAIGQYESSGNYKALGPVLPSGSYAGDRAYGKYQVMGKNVPSWTKKALGKSMTPQQFLNDPEAQDAVARYYMGMHLDKYGTPEDVAAIWLSGKPMQGNQAVDLATGVSVPRYIKNVMKYYNS